MTEPIHPGAVYLVGAALVALLPGRARLPLLILVPAAALALGATLPEGTRLAASFLGQELSLLRADRLSLVFGLVFVIMGGLGTLFALHLRERGPHMAAFVYVGAALGVVFAGDLLTLFVCWEVMAVASTFLIWGRGTARALAGVDARDRRPGRPLTSSRRRGIRKSGDVEFNQASLREEGRRMPLYEFYCAKCKKELSMTLTVRERERGEVKCPDCQGTLEPLMATFYSKTSKKS